METVKVEVIDIKIKRLDIQEALDFVIDDAHGAESLFVGTVRNNNKEKPETVTSITYDVFDPLALKSFQDIAQETQQKYRDANKIYIGHAKGKLNVNDISVLIAVGSPHRQSAIKACHHIIELLKVRSPIWKLEHYDNNNAEWLDGAIIQKAG